MTSAAVAIGCGGDGEFANRPRPPAPINVTAAITDTAILVSPASFGAGPVTLVISNQSGDPQEVTLETEEVAGSGPGLRQTTSAINPNGTATLQVDLRRGGYEVRTRDDAIRPAAVRVGRPRASGDQLQRP